MLARLLLLLMVAGLLLLLVVARLLLLRMDRVLRMRVVMD